MSGTTSFQKKSKGKILQIPGTRPSLHNNQLLISTGIPSLDNLLGGGVAVGTVVLIEEDTFGSYSRLMLKYFISEAVVSQQALLVASADVDPTEIIQELPAPLVDDPGKETTAQQEGSGDNLQIAWRYQNMPQVQSSVQGSRFGHYYDLTKSMPSHLLNATPTTLHYGNDEISNSHQSIMNPTYANLLSSIQSEVQKSQHSTTGVKPMMQDKQILRVAIHSLGSPLWGETGGLDDSHHTDHSLPRFLFTLRALMRSAFGVCLITMPTHLFHDISFIRRISHLCDTVLHLESFTGSVKEKNPAFKEYHGLFNIRKLPRLNSLTCHMPDTLDLAFKLKRKKFMIERLHLPPELSETASRGDQEDPVMNLKKTPITCGSAASSKLDF